MWLKWLPWKFTVRWLARRHGFLDPIAALGYLRNFAQPSEVAEPIELLRAGIIFHARGLMNSRAIQHNLDWIWPYWVERQFDPEDESFLPRAFSITHINLTHRNWTAVGLPEVDAIPIVDPRGLVTPLYDAWSLDAWIVTEDGKILAPSELKPNKQPKDTRGMTQSNLVHETPTVEGRTHVSQRLILEPNLSVITESDRQGMRLVSEAKVVARDGKATCQIQLSGESDAPAWLAVALRPCNAEGVSFIHRVELNAERSGWKIENIARVSFSEAAERHAVSMYREGDVAIKLPNAPDRAVVQCEVGMATAVALFRIEVGRPREIEVYVPLTLENEAPIAVESESEERAWADALEGSAVLRVPDARMQFLYDAAIRTMVLHSPDDVYPGPYTYKRFWFRDAAFILNALLCAGFRERVARSIELFFPRQNRAGYFESQDGEWDSNGEALWIMQRFCDLTGTPPRDEWTAAIIKGAEWIARKRLPDDGDSPHAGLLPAGFSAEHLGPNDFYFWDDFWGVAGLRSAAAMLRARGHEAKAAEMNREAEKFMRAIDASLEKCAERLARPAMPASPHRRMDAGAIGSITAGYPLQLVEARDPRLLDTTEFLLNKCMVHGGFFQDMIHSGVNPYLTLQLAQILMRAGDARWELLVEATAALASPTGQWPEAVHPRTLGGCMGDGQHVWAAAEWVMMIRNSFFYEEERGGRLVIGAGISERMLAAGKELSFGPSPTVWGEATVTINPNAENIEVAWKAEWRGAPPVIEVRLSGRAPVIAQGGDSSITLARKH